MFRLNFNASISSHFACPQTRPPKLGFKAVAEVVKTFVTRRKPKLLTSSATNVAEGKEKWAEVHYGLSSAILFGRRKGEGGRRKGARYRFHCSGCCFRLS